MIMSIIVTQRNDEVEVQGTSGNVGLSAERKEGTGLYLLWG